MKQSLFLFIVCAGLFAAALPMQAQGGCVNSPENPTVVLALVGAGGAFLASVRRRVARRRRSQSL